MTSIVSMCCPPGVTAAVTSKTDGVNDVVFVAINWPSIASAASWFTAPSSINVVCGTPSAGTVMVRA